jgi:RNA polymerase sigma factor (sigma-70 family)
VSRPPVPDTELLARARQGDVPALAELRERHVAVVRRLASSYRRAAPPDDLVDDTFDRAVTAIRGMTGEAGLGQAFRVYLFATLRRLAAQHLARSRGDPVDELPSTMRDPDLLLWLDPDERAMVLAAYQSLPERWQLLLWQAAVEARQPEELGPTFGMSATAAAALAYRGREKLRQAYLETHLAAVPRPGCVPHAARLVAYLRDGLGRRDQAATEDHIAGCAACRGLLDELRAIDRLLVRAVHPYFLADT